MYSPSSLKEFKASTTYQQKPEWMEIWLADLPLDSHSDVTGGTRPVTIISNNNFNFSSNLITAIPLSSQKKRMDLPSHVLIHGDHLKKSSIALCEQIQTIEQSRLRHKIGKINNENEQRAIYHAIAIQFGLC